MTEAKIRKVVEEFAAAAKKIYGSKLISIILYGSCARGDFNIKQARILPPLQVVR